MGPLIILVVTFGLMWVLFILPQQRRVKAHEALVKTIGVGDEVMTTAGLFGIVVTLDGEVVTLEVAPEVHLRFARGAIARRVDQVLPGEELEPPEAADPLEPPELSGGDGGSETPEVTAETDVAGEDEATRQPVGPAIRRRRGLLRRRGAEDGPAAE